MKPQESPAAAALVGEDFSATESHLAKVLVLIQRILPRLDDPGRAAEIQSTLRQAAASLESARFSHEQAFAPRKVTAVAPGSLESETVAIISAAIAAILERPYRLVSVQPAPTAVPHLNVWALEGRTQIFHSHKIR